MSDASLLTIDVGNSRVKLAWFTTSTANTHQLESTQGVRWSHGDEPQWPNVLPQRVLIGSVAPDHSNALIKAFPSEWPTPTVVESIDIRLLCEGPIAVQVGVDRLANAKAATILCPRESVIIVDAGTATTVDWVDADGAFRGGAILPGLQLSANALTDRTELLPPIPMAERTLVKYPGTKTADAIRLGAQAAAIGGVQHAIEQARNSSRDDPRILCCGGDGEFLAATIDDAEFIQGLTILGLTWFDRP